MGIAPINHSKPTLLPDNFVVALMLGTLVGSIQLAALSLAAALVPALSQGGFGEALSVGAPLAMIFFLFSLPVWASGLIAIGVPGWIALHALGWRSRSAGAAFGGVATFGVSLILGLRLNPSMADKPWGLIPLAGVLALMGAVVGWTVAATAYAPDEVVR